MGLNPIRAQVPEEQLKYAQWLDWGTRIGFVTLIATFCAYAAGWAEPHVSFRDLPRYWSLPIGQYLAATGGPVGWGWLGLAGHGDYMNFVGVAFLASVTMACYVRILPALAARGDWAFAAIAALELVVLAAAASGLVSGGH